VAAKAGHWLRRRLSNVAITGSGASGLSLSLVNGDVNGDNSVSLADFGQLKLAYGSNASSSNWNPNADLDGNGSVGLSDFGILKLHYGAAGDQ
ncbi:MAG TPA: dockerin type I domain-containing protein, partial [Fimbriimonadaceae bacterium]|nr:dockerin type I domain-containing protein [Fimbriimonadaceae bacterium]